MKTYDIKKASAEGIDLQAIKSILTRIHNAVAEALTSV